MLIQTSSPRPILSLDEHPKHVVVHTLRKLGVSSGDVLLNMNTDLENGARSTGAVAPYEIFPIEGEPGFEALEYYLPFDQIFGSTRVEYNETEILTRMSTSLERPAAKPIDPRRDTLMALYAASGISVIAKSAFRAEGSRYEERTLNLQLFFPVTGGGIIRVAGSMVDISNPTFDPKAPMPGPAQFKNLTLLAAFNRTHKVGNSVIEARKRARVAAAEASMLAERGLPKKEER